MLSNFYAAVRQNGPSMIRLGLVNDFAVDKIAPLPSGRAGLKAVADSPGVRVGMTGAFSA